MKYSFIEIGTSDFDTLIQESSDEQVGLSIEPIKYYLDRLPNKPNVTKIQAAVSDKEGFLDIYYIPDEDITKYALPWWVRGSNSVNHPHTYTIQQLGENIYNKLVKIDIVPTITWPTLIKEYNIESIEYLKIDTEGHDHVILNSYFDECDKNPVLLAKKIKFEALQGVSNLPEIEKLLLRIKEKYSIERGQMDIVLTKFIKHEKVFVLYATESYKDTVQGCVNSLKAVSNIPIYVYMLSSSEEINGATTINWKCNIVNVPQEEYINRLNPDIYKIMIQRPSIVIDCLKNYAETVCYIDADSVATEYANNIFNYFPENNKFPYFVEGIYDEYFINGRGNLTVPALELFDIPDGYRPKYRQTGYFVAGQGCIEFLQEWEWMCNHPKILQNPQHYAAFHEETILQTLLQKENINDGLPLIYVNSNPNEINDIGFSGIINPVREWLKIPAHKEQLMFYHGEKNLEKMNQIIAQLNNKPLRILFLESHLSSGGGPQFLLKRLQTLQNIEVFVVEYQCYGLDYVVQRNAIMEIVGDSFKTLYEDKTELFNVIDIWKPDIIHIDNVAEMFDENIINRLYSVNRKYKIIETCHDVVFNPQNKKWNPDCYAFCTPYHLETFKHLSSLKTVIEYPIDNNLQYKEAKGDVIHVLNIGLWCEWKNQAEGIEIAKNNPNMQFDFVGNQAGNFQEYWGPLMKDLPSNVTVWGERSDVNIFYEMCDIFMFNSVNECNPLVLREAIGYGLPIIARNLPQYGDMFTKYIQPLDSDLNTIQRNYEIPTDNSSEIFAKNHEELYRKVMNISPMKQSPKKINITQHFVDGPFLEITGDSDSLFTVRFYDEADVCQYEHTINCNCWVRLNRKWYTKWTAKVWQDGVLIYENVLDYTGKRVFITFESSSLGDSIAWIPYVEEFRKKHNCNVIVCTHKNFLFEKRYKELQFVEPGTTVDGLYGLYRIGWFYDENKEPVQPNTIPLQQTATNILGLEYKEILPKINFTPKKNPYKSKYITICTNSTSQLKFWTIEGWTKLTAYLLSKGYKVINVSKEKNPIKGVMQIEDASIENTMNVIHHSEFIIGLSSGLLWLGWSMNKDVVLISNFTSKDHEMQNNCTRIINENVCHGCWNEPNTIFDKGNWTWCKHHENDDRRFECHNSISAEMVIEQIQSLII